ncbi:MAG: pyridoxal phosphate-dependent aminotransferase [Burkholderiales bacterium]|nr:pyridoxal phosphate-dependent aminotransferase [Burkholderiales bacterium]
MGVYASKNISLKAEKIPGVMNLSFGEPEFGPPEYLLEKIQAEGLSLETFLSSVKRYEDPRGSLKLRKAVSSWYHQHYGLIINPETEIMITHGGVEAITLSILCTSDAGDSIMISSPSYMLYERTIKILNREPFSLERSTSDSQYADALNEELSDLLKNKHKIRMMIVNSPENPSGYVLNKEDWEAVHKFCSTNDIWLVHDEVYDTMHFTRDHKPAGTSSLLPKNSVIINSFSKKFGIPGLRIGWLIANEEFIEQAAKAHDYMYLGVNIQYEEIARLILEDTEIDKWLIANSAKIHQRALKMTSILTEEMGYAWDRPPYGAMFLFPNVENLYKTIPARFRKDNLTVGEAVADYLLEVKKVAVVPGIVYGKNSSNHIRIVLCSSDDIFENALNQLSR